MYFLDKGGAALRSYSDTRIQTLVFRRARIRLPTRAMRARRPGVGVESVDHMDRPRGSRYNMWWTWNIY
jgi:hypothetical protein